MPRTLFKEKHPLDPNAGLLSVALEQFDAYAPGMSQATHMPSATSINSHQLVIMDVPGWRTGEINFSICIFYSNEAFCEVQSRHASCGELCHQAKASKMPSQSFRLVQRCSYMLNLWALAGDFEYTVTSYTSDWVASLVWDLCQEQMRQAIWPLMYGALAGIMRVNIDSRSLAICLGAWKLFLLSPSLWSLWCQGTGNVSQTLPHPPLLMSPQQQAWRKRNQYLTSSRMDQLFPVPCTAAEKHCTASHTHRFCHNGG